MLKKNRGRSPQASSSSCMHTYVHKTLRHFDTFSGQFLLQFLVLATPGALYVFVLNKARE